MSAHTFSSMLGTHNQLQNATLQRYHHSYGHHDRCLSGIHTHCSSLASSHQHSSKDWSGDLALSFNSHGNHSYYKDFSYKPCPRSSGPYLARILATTRMQHCCHYGFHFCLSLAFRREYIKKAITERFQ